MAPRLIRVLLVDDHALLLESMKRLLDRQPDIAVVGTIRDARSAIAAVEALEPAVVVMDISLPDCSGMAATREILSIAPATRVVALSGFNEQAYVRAMIEAGAVAYVMKTEAVDELADAVRRVAAGETYFGRCVPPPHGVQDAGATSIT